MIILQQVWTDAGNGRILKTKMKTFETAVCESSNSSQFFQDRFGVECEHIEARRARKRRAICDTD